MENATFHKKAIMTKIAEDAGHHVLFFPPYSPDFNPIEQAFATLKKKQDSSGRKIDN